MARPTISDGLTPLQLRSALDYDPETGVFRWAINLRRIKAGTQAGHRCPRLGYVLLGLYGRLYRAHRLAWLHVTGYWPEGDIDHINGDGYDNRIANLRVATRTENNGNMRRPKHNTSGLKGAYWDKRAGKWLAQIKHRRQQHHLGFYDTAEEAHAAYCAAAARLHGDFARSA